MDSSAAPSKPGNNVATGLPTKEAPHSNLENALEHNEEEELLYNSTRIDAGDMRRMGKSQELIRHYHLSSIVSFSALATSAWELALFQATPGIINGGLPTLIYSNVWCFIGFFPVVLSLAEMASMAPIAGAQFHWVSEFAPREYQKLLSYLTGYALPAIHGEDTIVMFVVLCLVLTAHCTDGPQLCPTKQETPLVSS